MTIFSVSEDVENIPSSCIAGGKEHFYNKFWKHFDLSTEVKHNLLCDIAIPLFSPHMQINLCMCPQKYMYSSANSSFIHNSQNSEAIQVQGQENK